MSQGSRGDEVHMINIGRIFQNRYVSASKCAIHFRDVAFLVGLATLAACGSQTIAPAAPLALADSSSIPALPVLEASVVDAPIRYALEPLVTALEATVPRHFGNIENRIPVKGNKRKLVAFDATRGPFTVRVQNGKLILSSVISYEARGWFRPALGPTLSAGCRGTEETNSKGVSHNLRPRVRIVLSSDLSLNPDWKLITRTRVASVKPLTETERDQCRVTFLDIDVTGQVVEAVTPEINKRLPAVDRRVRSIDVRSRAVKWFAALQRNIRVSDSVWLQLRPERVSVGELALEDSMLVADVRLWARPQMVSGPEPVSTDIALPKLQRAEHSIGDSARLFIDGLLDYGVASAMMMKEIGGKRFYRYNHWVGIDSLELYPLGDGRVVLAVTVKGSVRGKAYLTGTPTIDHRERMLTVADLDFDVATNEALATGLSWLKKGGLLQRLRAAARFPLDPILEDARVHVSRAVNRELTRGVDLSGAVIAGRLVDVIVHPQWLVVRAEAAGRLALDIDRPIKAGH